ncbi:Fe-S cluster assembly protein SufD [Psychromicrobium xiongbiense]|uniref:Fe-S cluster assembly protein SufD n=1 Tax=Psychromicrobium xiongbiense TaxID=3051184 RepID=UPI002555C892|nr:Fe-S cluster assembly protein SufD [Psychromicrobium sp. YIM S02556]
MSEEGETLLASKVDKHHSHGSTGDTTVMASRAERLTSFSIDDFALPTGLEEEWRFTPVKKLARLFALTSPETGTSEQLSWETSVPEGVVIDSVDADGARELVSAAPADRAAAAALVNSQGAVTVTIPANLELTEPVKITLRGAGGAPAFGHVVFTIGENAKAVIVVDHQGSAEYSELLSINAGAGSEVTFVSTQRWANDAVHAGQHDVLVGKDANFKHVAVTLGGALVRLNVNARYADIGGEVELFGLYYADAGQHLEHRTFVDHNVANAKSNVLYKGALQGAGAHTVWVGDVLIQKQALGTDSYEKNQNLILTDGARADSVPNLEIETGLIEGAGHASSTGRFDDEHLFYLQARGIPEDVARRLVVRGYLHEILQKMQVPALEEELAEALEEELNASEAL